MKRRALISVFCKDGILELASYLSDAGWEILSTGGTSKYLSNSKVPVLPGDTTDSLAERVHKEEHIAIVEAVKIMTERLQNKGGILLL